MYRESESSQTSLILVYKALIVQLIFSRPITESLLINSIVSQGTAFSKILHVRPGKTHIPLLVHIIWSESLQDTVGR